MKLKSTYNLTSWFLTISVCLLMVLGSLAVKLWPRTVPLEQCSEVYRKYADTPGVKASFIKDYRVCYIDKTGNPDTVIVDVTLLKADDSNGWNTLFNDFNIVQPDPETQEKIDKGEDKVFTRQVYKSDYSQPARTKSGDVEVVAFSHLRKTVCIFHTKNKREKQAIIFYNFNKSSNN